MADRRLSIGAKAVARIIAEGRPVTIEAIAEKTGYSPRGVYSMTRRLEAAGYLNITVKTGRGGPNVYRPAGGEARP